MAKQAAHATLTDPAKSAPFTDLTRIYPADITWMHAEIDYWADLDEMTAVLGRLVWARNAWRSPTRMATPTSAAIATVQAPMRLFLLPEVSQKCSRFTLPTVTSRRVVDFQSASSKP